MATAEAERFVLYGVTWDAYVALRDAPENYHVRMTYDRGTLEMMSPSRRHERIAVLLELLLHVWCDESDIAMSPCRTMTLRRKDVKRGLEPDNCYYVQHESQMRAKEDLDLDTDPPPDLAIEVAVSREALGKLRIYSALGVPEVWHCDGRKLVVYLLGAGGNYQQQGDSAAFPGFPLAEAERVLGRLGTIDETSLVRSFRGWVRANGPKR
jgi:Uma2 family endonuclease